ncbi:tetratricopeptide repeat protein [Patescibacteria group bacterium]|nr:tetratricopeptide repeat protein [Patescibacteria group bacterium]
MNERDKKIKKYLEERNKALKQRKGAASLIKKKRNYAVDELPERKAVGKILKFAWGVLGKKFKRVKTDKKFRGKEYEKRKQVLKKVTGDKNKDKLAGLLSKGIDGCIFLILFLMPLAIFPLTPNPTEFIKQIILVLFTGLGVLFWLGKMILQDKVRIRRSFLLIPVIVFVIAYALSGIFSVYPYISVWGSFGKEWSSLVSLIALVFFFLLVSNNVNSAKKAKQMLWVFLFSSFLAAIYAALQFQGLHVIEFGKLENRLINTVGTTYSSAVYFCALAILASGLSVFSKKKLEFFSYFVFVLGFLWFLSFCYFKSLWLLFVFAAGLMLAIGIAERKVRAQGCVFAAGLVFSFSLFSFLVGKPIFDTGTAPTEMMLGAKKSAEVAIKSIKENPFLGSGPGTFLYNYELYKPDLGRVFISGADYPVSYLVFLGATTGLLTFICYLFLLFVLSRFVAANVSSKLLGKKGDGAVSALGVLWLFLTLSSFVYLNSMLVFFLWWFVLALIDINRPKKMIFKAGFDKNKKSGRIDFMRISLIVSILFVTYLACFSAVIYMSGRRLKAAVYYQTGLDKNAENKDLKGIAADIKKAGELDKTSDLYQRNIAVIYFALAKERVNELGNNFSGEDSKYISENMSRAVISGQRAIELNAHDFLNYKNMGWLYHEMGNLDQGFGDKALSYYQKALELSRNNPDLYYQIGDLYLDMYNTVVEKNKDKKIESNPELREYLLSARENLERALEINEWHFGSNILLVTVFELLGEEDQAFDKALENWELFSGNAQAGFSLAVQYYRRNEYRRAQTILEAVLKSRPTYSNAGYLLGFCLAQMGKLDQALDQFEKIQLRNPKNEELAKIIDDLRKGRVDFLKTWDQK